MFCYNLFISSVLPNIRILRKNFERFYVKGIACEALFSSVR